MKIFYIASSIIPSRSANSVHVMKMVNAYSLLGHDVTLIVPKQRNKEESNVFDIFDYYGVKKFKIVYFPWLKFPGSKYLYSFMLSLWIYINMPNLVYSRDFYPAVHTSFLRIPTIMEFHGPPKLGSHFYKFYIKKFYLSEHTNFVVISNTLKNIFKSYK